MVRLLILAALCCSDPKTPLAATRSNDTEKKKAVTVEEAKKEDDTEVGDKASSKDNAEIKKERKTKDILKVRYDSHCTRRGILRVCRILQGRRGECARGSSHNLFRRQ